MGGGPYGHHLVAIATFRAWMKVCFIDEAGDLGAVAAASGLPGDWLNDAVKGYLSDREDFHRYLDLSNLRVLTASPEYLLAMKCLAMRLGEGFHDEDDVRFLLRYLNLTDYGKALEVVTRYYPRERLPQKTLYALEEMLESPERD